MDDTTSTERDIENEDEMLESETLGDELLEDEILEELIDEEPAGEPGSEPPRPLALDLEGIYKIYKTKEVEVVALRGLDLKVKRGEIISIMGPSGCGKSTLLNLIGGLDKPSAGKAIIDGVNVVNLEPDELITFRKHKVGYVFQFFNLVPTLTAAENVELPMRLLDVPAKKRVARRKELLKVVGMAQRSHHRPDEMSAGEQQRVAIASALANDPPIILADEPTGELDTDNGQMVLDLFKRLREEHGKTIVIVTHDPRIATMADRSMRIEDGIISGEYSLESYLRKGGPVDNIRYKRLVENIVDKQKRMEVLFSEIMKIEQDLMDDLDIET